MAKPNYRPFGYESKEAGQLHDASRDLARSLTDKKYLAAKSFAVSVTAGNTTVVHGLKRRPVGWWIHSVLGSSGVATVEVIELDDKSIVLNSSADGSCVLEVW